MAGRTSGPYAGALVSINAPGEQLPLADQFQMVISQVNQVSQSLWQSVNAATGHGVKAVKYSSDLDLDNHRILNLADPQRAQDAVNLRTLKADLAALQKQLDQLVKKTNLPPVIGGFTPGSVIFAGSNGQFAEDPPNFFYDDPNNRLGLGTNAPLTPADFRAPDPTRGIIARLANSTNPGTTGAQLQFSQLGIGDWVLGLPGGLDLFSLWHGRTPSADGTEVWRVNTAGAFVKYASSVPADGQIFIGGTAAGTWIPATLTAGAGVTITNGNNTITIAVSGGGGGIGGFTADSMVYANGAGVLTSTANPTNGQLLIGSTGADPVLAVLLGTANQIAVTNGAGAITLGLPAAVAIATSVACPLFTNANADVMLSTTVGGNVVLSPAGDIKWGKALVALGGGAAPTLGTIGGSGPTAAAQNSWLQLRDSGGNLCWVPVWK